jgi:tetratricopeptide (TPR) repeat protein
LGVLNLFMGDVKFNLFQFQEALHCYQECCFYIKRYQGDGVQGLLLTSVYEKIAVCFYLISEYDNSLFVYEIVMDLKSRFLEKNCSSMVETFNNVAENYRKLCQFERALNYFSKSLSILFILEEKEKKRGILKETSHHPNSLSSRSSNPLNSEFSLHNLFF